MWRLAKKRSVSLGNTFWTFSYISVLDATCSQFMKDLTLSGWYFLGKNLQGTRCVLFQLCNCASMKFQVHPLDCVLLRCDFLLIVQEVQS